MRKIVWASLIFAVIGFTVWSSDPLDDAVNFIIGGSIPGTTLALGLWPTLLIAIGITLVIRRGIRRARLQMLDSTAKQIKSEAIKNDFAEKNSGHTFDKSKRSVIAAPTSDPVM